MTVDSELLNIQANTENAESVKNLVIDSLVKLEYISDTDAEKFLSQYGVIIVKQSWFKRIFGSNETFRYVIAKMM